MLRVDIQPQPGLNDFIIIIFYKYYDLSEVVSTFLSFFSEPENGCPPIGIDQIFAQKERATIPQGKVALLAYLKIVSLFHIFCILQKIE